MLVRCRLSYNPKPADGCLRHIDTLRDSTAGAHGADMWLLESGSYTILLRRVSEAGEGATSLLLAEGLPVSMNLRSFGAYKNAIPCLCWKQVSARADQELVAAYLWCPTDSGAVSPHDVNGKAAPETSRNNKIDTCMYACMHTYMHTYISVLVYLYVN